MSLSQPYEIWSVPGAAADAAGIHVGKWGTSAYAHAARRTRAPKPQRGQGVPRRIPWVGWVATNLRSRLGARRALLAGMRTRPVVVQLSLVVSLLALGACGGVVAPAPEDPPATAPAPGPGAPPTGSSTPTPTAPPTPTPPPTPTAPPTPPASVASGATRLVVSTGVLGGVGCNSERFELTMATQELVTFGCPPGSGEPGAPRVDLVEQRRRVLRPEDSRSIAAELERLVEVPMPSMCLYDGRAYALTVERGATSTRYIDEDYNCLHDKSVKYTRSLGALTGLLRAAP